MRIESVRARGFIGFKRGLGLDEISVDFTNISGLIALEGDNGSGKSSLIELLHPYPQLASRDGALFHHVFTRDAEKELSFAYGGHHYRTLLKIDAQSEKQEGYIWKDGHPEVNGKISQYGKYIKALLGSPDLFFNSVFCAQNSAKLSDLTTGELKGLFAEFLRLDRYQQWTETAKQAGNILDGKAAQLSTRIAALETALKRWPELTSELELEQKDEDRYRQQMEAYRKHIAEARVKMDGLKDVLAKNGQWQALKAAAERQVEKLRTDLAAEKETAEAEIAALKESYKLVHAEIVGLDALLKDREAIEGAVTRQGELEETVDALVASMERQAGSIDRQKGRVRDLEIEIQEFKNSCTEEVNKVKLSLSEKRAELNLNTTRLRILQDKTSDLNKKDRECQSVTCSFIKGALDASKDIPVVQKAISDITAEITEIEQAATTKSRSDKERVDVKDAKLKEEDAILEQFTRLRQTNQTALFNTRQELKAVKELAAKAPDIHVTEARRQDVEKKRLEIADQGKAKREAIDKREAAASVEIKCYQDEAAGYDKQIDTGAAERLTALQTETADMESLSMPAVEKKIVECRERIATCQAELVRCQEADREHKEAVKERDALRGDAADWRYIQNACGKNGLQALEIDGTAPLITSFANNLLADSFGPLFTVKMITQDADGKECLDILVITEDGAEILSDDLSGGQKVWVLMALRLAMTLLSKEKSGRAFDTAFADELDGALDPDNALNFVGMYRSFMKAGGFESFLFISHKPSCRGMADNILKFEAGKAPYWA